MATENGNREQSGSDARSGAKKAPTSVELSEFPFLTVALEDYALALRLAGDTEGNGRQVANMRQAVCFMHDALEFLFYEVLLARDADIYKTGQNTIGFDDALEECRKRGVSLPLIGLIRTIQKQRGDAKHHAQTPHGEAAQRLSTAFRVIFSVIAFENFGQVLAPELAKRGLYPFHLSLYELYRRARGHDWEKALMLGVRAFVHKRRAIYRSNDDFSTHRLKNPEGLISVLEGSASLSATPEERQGISLVAASLRQAVSVGDAKGAAEGVGSAFSSLDFVAPTIFDITRARRLTERLYQPSGLAVSGMWGGSMNGVRELLRSNPDFVKSFGRPLYSQDEDRDWSWWEFVVFDGLRWHSFHMDEDFSVKLELNLPGEVRKGGPNLAQVIVEEFSKAVATVGKVSFTRLVSNPRIPRNSGPEEEMVRSPEGQPVFDGEGHCVLRDGWRPERIIDAGPATNFLVRLFSVEGRPKKWMKHAFPERLGLGRQHDCRFGELSLV
jgi:hypothetical protein